MTLSAMLTGIVMAATAYPALLPVAIIIGTFILEDAATILVGVMAADGTVSAPVGLASLYAGIVLGDFGLYSLGRLTVSHQWVRRYVSHQRLDPFRDLLQRQLILAVISTRFLPGARLPTYLACGLFHVPFGRFAFSVVVATAMWTTLLFGAAYTFGAYTTDWLGVLRWPASLLILVVILSVARFAARRGRLLGKGSDR
jgi:membrane protein DedA with SNARE-associated domain